MLAVHARETVRGSSVVWVAFVALAHKNDHVVERQWILFSRGQVVEELVDSGLLVSKTALTQQHRNRIGSSWRPAAMRDHRRRNRMLVTDSYLK